MHLYELDPRLLPFPPPDDSKWDRKGENQPGKKQLEMKGVGILDWDSALNQGKPHRAIYSNPLAIPRLHVEPRLLRQYSIWSRSCSVSLLSRLTAVIALMTEALSA